MKSMICKQLGGACEGTFQASTFEDMAEQSKKKVWKCFKKEMKDI
jgi:hypothetical protein